MDTKKLQSPCLSHWLLSPFVGFSRWGWRGSSPRTQNHLMFGKGLWFMNQTVKFRSHRLVLRALFKIFTEPLTTSTCSSFVVMFSGMIFKCSVMVFFIIPVAPTITGPISVFFNCHILWTSFFRFWNLIICLISVAFSPKSLGTETLINNGVFSFSVWATCPDAMLCLWCPHLMGSSCHTWASFVHFRGSAMVCVSMIVQ